MSRGERLGQPNASPASDGTPVGTAKRLQDQAARLFWEKGYSATSVRDLADAIGVRPASLYNHMANKEDLLVALSVQSLDHIQTAVESALDSEPTEDRLDRVRTLIHSHLTTALEDKEKHAVMLLELRSLSEPHRTDVLSRRAQYEAIVRQTVLDAQASGALREDIPGKVLSLLLLNLLNWAIFWFRPEGDVTADALAEWAASVFIDGARRGP